MTPPTARRWRTILAACVLAPATACDGQPALPPQDAGLPDAAVACRPAPPPRATSAPPGRLYLSTSDYSVGALRGLRLADRGASSDLAPLTGDALLAWHGATLVALNYSGSGQDNVTFIDVAAEPPQVLHQIAMRRSGERGGGNPRSYLPLCENRALVARFNQGDLAMVDPVAGEYRDAESIRLADFRVGDSSPYPNALTWVGSTVWATIDRLPPGLTNPTVPGAVVVVDPVARAVLDADTAMPGVQAIELRHANPVGALVPRGNTLVVACAGAYQRTDDGAVEELDPATLRSTRDLVTEADVHGNIDAVVVLDADRLLLRVASEAVGTGLDIAETRLVEWTISAQRARDWLRVPRYALTAPLLASDGRVYVGDRGDEVTAQPAGMRVFDATTGSELTPSPVAVGLPPYYLVEQPAP